MPLLLLSFVAVVLIAQGPRTDPNQLARRAVQNELKSEAQDVSHWLFRLQAEKPKGGKRIDLVVETHDGDLKRPLLIDGRKISDQEANRRLRQQLENPSILRKSLNDKNEDSARSRRMLKMLPDAFTFQNGAQRGSVAELKFSPDPHFKPLNREAQVFHAMQGSLWVDTKQLRVEEINGRLLHEVKFAGGIFGTSGPGRHIRRETGRSRTGIVR